MALLGKREPEVPEYDPHDKDLCTRFGTTLRSQRDPSTGDTVRVKAVFAVFPQDTRGLVEVLYVEGASGYNYVNGVKQSTSGEPMTAFLRGRELAYITEGW